ncbi:hypothetical protein SIPHO059v1_p0091 [Vibrio phage 264E42.1]|nr:hypothetical protein SIPHO059v1_p0091 [Vibrio phage 264E42.1]
MTTQTLSMTEIKHGDFAGLLIEEIHASQLRGMKAVRVTHKSIKGFEARALVANDLGTWSIIEEVKNCVKLRF